MGWLRVALLSFMPHIRVCKLFGEVHDVGINDGVDIPVILID